MTYCVLRPWPAFWEGHEMSRRSTGPAGVGGQVHTPPHSSRGGQGEPEGKGGVPASLTLKVFKWAGADGQLRSQRL